MAFIAFMVVLSVAYGIAHDMVTAHVAVEYFTVHHPKIVDSKSPVVMALVWGVLATWWVGVGAGLVLVVANLVGWGPPLNWVQIGKKAALAMGLLWLGAMVLLGVSLLASPHPDLLSVRLAAVARTHLFSYGGAVCLILALATYTSVARDRLDRADSPIP